MKKIRFNSTFRLLAGAAAWLLWMAFQHPHPLEPAWARGVLLLAPLVIVPMGVELLLRSGYFSSEILKFLVKWQLPSALAFALAFLLPTGWLSTGLALPWVAITFALAWAGGWELLQGGWQNPVAFCLSAGMVYLSVAGVWAIFERSGFSPLGYDPEIVFLTIVHFHYAGFVLPVLTGLAVEKTGGIFTQIIGYLVVSGVGLVAVGIVFTQLGYGPDWEGVSAWWMALSAMAVAVMHLRLAFQKENTLKVKLMWGIAAAALLGGMLLAGMYGTRYLSPVVGLDIPTMRALHGTANALGFGFFGMLGWWMSGVWKNGSPLLDA